MEKSFVFLVFSCMLIKLGHVVPQAEATRAFFEFGDSLIDNVWGYSGEQIGSGRPTLPYLSGEKLLVGANFACVGIGILNDTGIQFVSPISI
ncbi:hypothetical protein Golax_015100 [Gossypium laxum]|uniref:Uncharacterized protein n=1 Tax=Gossypium laxum TaxID=34288 RepID=A0A7J8ZWS7_9ROSI|nr:hypothetical protein [Gossypium laxum]